MLTKILFFFIIMLYLKSTPTHIRCLDEYGRSAVKLNVYIYKPIVFYYFSAAWSATVGQ